MKISRQRRSFQATAMAAWARRGRGVVGCGAAGAIYWPQHEPISNMEIERPVMKAALSSDQSIAPSLWPAAVVKEEEWRQLCNRAIHQRKLAS